MSETMIEQTAGQKPYPRRCAECGELSVQRTTIGYDAQIKHDGTVHEFRIAKLPVDRCESCREEFFTNASSDAKSEALRRQLGLLQPEQIRQMLTELELTERQFAKHLRVAEDTVLRWLNGMSIQSRALDALMRIYFTKPEARAALATEGSLMMETDLPPGGGNLSPTNDLI
jgi:DNA-binding transcriptional regulator YiaG